MKDELTSSETAKLAKEKGFNWSTYKCYDVETDNICNSNQEYPENVYSRVGNISAPTQSLLQRWLREEHTIHISIEPNYTISLGKKSYHFIVKVFTGRYQDIEYQSIGQHKTYEEVLEVGLFEALKLIE